MLFSNHYLTSAAPPQDGGSFATIDTRLDSIQGALPRGQAYQRPYMPIIGETKTDELLALHQELQTLLLNSNSPVLAQYAEHVAEEFSRLIDTNIVELFKFLQAIRKKLDFFLFLQRALVFSTYMQGQTEISGTAFESHFANYDRQEEDSHHHVYDRASTTNPKNIATTTAAVELDRIYAAQLACVGDSDAESTAQFQTDALYDYASFTVEFAKPQLENQLQQIVQALLGNNIALIITSMSALTTQLRQLLSTNHVSFENEDKEYQFINQQITSLLTDFFENLDQPTLHRLAQKFNSEQLQTMNLMLHGHLREVQQFAASSNGSEMYGRNNQAIVAVGLVLTTAQQLESIFTSIANAVLNTGLAAPQEDEVQRQFYQRKHHSVKSILEQQTETVAKQQQEKDKFIAVLQQRFAAQAFCGRLYQTSLGATYLAQVLSSNLSNTEQLHSNLNQLTTYQSKDDQTQIEALILCLNRQLKLNQQLKEVINGILADQRPRLTAQQYGELSALATRQENYSTHCSCLRQVLGKANTVGHVEVLQITIKNILNSSYNQYTHSHWHYPASAEAIAIYTPSTFYQFINEFMNLCINNLSDEKGLNDHNLSLGDKADVFRHFLHHANVSQFNTEQGICLHPFNAILDFINSDLFVTSQKHFDVVNQLHLHLSPNDARIIKALAIDVKEFFNRQFVPAPTRHRQQPTQHAIEKVQMLHAHKLIAKDRKLSQQGRFSRFGQYQFVPAGIKVMDAELDSLPERFAFDADDKAFMHQPAKESHLGFADVLKDYNDPLPHDTYEDDDAMTVILGADEDENPMDETLDDMQSNDHDDDSSLDDNDFMSPTRASLKGLPDFSSSGQKKASSTGSTEHVSPDMIEQNKLEEALEDCDMIFRTLQREIYTVKNKPYQGIGYRTELMQRTWNTICHQAARFENTLATDVLGESDRSNHSDTGSLWFAAV